MNIQTKANLLEKVIIRSLYCELCDQTISMMQGPLFLSRQSFRWSRDSIRL